MAYFPRNLLRLRMLCTGLEFESPYEMNYWVTISQNLNSLVNGFPVDKLIHNVIVVDVELRLSALLTLSVKASILSLTTARFVPVNSRTLFGACSKL